MTRPEQTAVVACMRNEGLFVLEWVAYHRVIGFDDIVICTNDCTDGSDALLDMLANAGAVTHLRHIVASGDTPQDSGMRAAFEHLQRTDAQWLAHIDADEFLNIGLGAGKLPDLLAMAAMGDVIALPWWAFGDSAHKHWPGALLPNFTQSETRPVPARCKFKSMFRFRNFTHANDHMPTGPKISAPDVRSACGERLKADGFDGEKRAKYRPFDASIVPSAACINHYAVPSQDAFLLKNDRGDGQGKSSDKYHIGSRWHQVANQNAMQNTSILRHWPSVQAEIARLEQLPGVAQASAYCLEWFQTRCEALLTPTQVALWTKPDHKRIAL